MRVKYGKSLSIKQNFVGSQGLRVIGIVLCNELNKELKFVSDQSSGQHCLNLQTQQQRSFLHYTFSIRSSHIIHSYTLSFYHFHGNLLCFHSARLHSSVGRGGSPRGVHVPLFPSKINLCSLVPTIFPHLFPTLQI